MITSRRTYFLQGKWFNTYYRCAILRDFFWNVWSLLISLSKSSLTMISSHIPVYMHITCSEPHSDSSTSSFLTRIYRSKGTSQPQPACVPLSITPPKAIYLEARHQPSSSGCWKHVFWGRPKEHIRAHKSIVPFRKGRTRHSGSLYS